VLDGVVVGNLLISLLKHADRAPRQWSARECDRPDHVDTGLADQLEHVGAETIVVGELVAGLVDPVVDTATKVLDEGTESRRFTVSTAK
jgi:hypothetical protein